MTEQPLTCESQYCGLPARYAYGPECERETGKLMYLCGWHAEFVKSWIAMHANDPVECPTHGNIGPVKDHVVLTKLPRQEGKLWMT